MKKCVMEAAKVASDQAKAAAVVSQLHMRSEEAEAACLVTRRLEELQEKHALVQVMLGKEQPSSAVGDAISGMLGARMYASMVKRGIVISELATSKNGHMQLKEFTATVKGFVPTATKEDIGMLFDELDKDGGGDLDAKELVALMYVIQKHATEAAASESSLVAAINAAAEAACAAQAVVTTGIQEDLNAEKAEAQAAVDEAAAHEVKAKEAIAKAMAIKAAKAAIRSA